MKKQIDVIPATPKKRIFLSIIADYDLKLGICELIDNAIDSWNKQKPSQPLEVKIELDFNQQVIRFTDNAGGVKRDNIDALISPGGSTNEESDDAIGIFGVGSKRAVIALAKHIRIGTRHKNEKTIWIEIDDTWLNEENWDLPIYEYYEIDPNTTTIELSQLRSKIQESVQDIILLQTLSKVYLRFLKKGQIFLYVNGRQAIHNDYDIWSYPPEHKPKQFFGTINTHEKEEILYEITAGLSKSVSEINQTSNDFGVYFYCNDRLIEAAVQRKEVGFTTGLAGQPHPSMLLVRVIVDIYGKSRLMPWNSSKSQISYDHFVFKELGAHISELTSHFAKVCKRLSENDGLKEKVFPFQTGSIEKVKFDQESKLVRHYLPPIPPKPRKKYEDEVRMLNKAIIAEKFLCEAHMETIIVVDSIFKTQQKFKTRICLLLLDSMLEIAFKEYLAFYCGTQYNETRLSTLFSNRVDVQNEVAKYIPLTIPTWIDVDIFYKNRCELVHKRATVDIPEDTIIKFREVAEILLEKMFGLKFPPTSA
jgi:Signal transduction histidine kinase regulating citrate/malate metabolism